MAKTCIFCGEHPAVKTKEHVIPKWLIELTGDPKRHINLGWDKKKIGEELVTRSFAFDQLTFPACKHCNETYSGLEARSKDIVLKILAAEPVTPEQVTDFFDWFDKVRVGLWLGFLQLDGNYAGVDPNFHINTRIGQHDRLLLVQKSDLTQKRLNFAGVDCLAFSFMPSAFSLAINNYFFLNVSAPFLFARRLGFPFSENEQYAHDGRMSFTVCKGEESISLPLTIHPLSPKGVAVFQPMFRCGLIEPEVECYDTNYVRLHSLNFEKGVGNVFVQRDSAVVEVASGELVDLTPSTDSTDSRLRVDSIIAVHQWQNWLFSQTADMSELPEWHRKQLEDKFAAAKDMNDALIEHHQQILDRV